jgi:para-aminobenzoate synthetase component 1
MIVREIDWRSPLDAFDPLASEPFSVLLHAGAEARAPGWSTIAAFPSAMIEARGGATLLNGDEMRISAFEVLGRVCRERAAHAANGWPLAVPAPPLMTGLVGFVGYEMGASLEPSAAGPASPFELPDMAFGAYNACAVFNRRLERAFICAHTDDAASSLAGALGTGPSPPVDLLRFGAVASNFSKPAYEHAVADVVELIREGAIFQANIAQQLRVEAERPFAAFDVYRRIATGDAPFAAFLNYSEGAIVSSSPERFFRIDGDRRIFAEPIKGTRARSADSREDRRLADELISDRKERAENVMIADLVRNDLSRISKDGSLKEEAICSLESFSHVHHLVSRISGELRDGVTAVDALSALFPCGSITGAPKVEAMKTIASIEGVGRGPYCGAIGYIDDRGNADFAVAIRTLMVEGRCVTIPVGGGITLRSEPRSEFDETLQKARGPLSALGVEVLP